MSSILIVDDEKDIRELIGDILKDEGYAIRLAGNSDDCMAQINAELPSLMILDIWLKDSRMDGIDILKTVKRDNPDVPVVIISGHGNIEIAVAAIKQGAYDFIEKPFNIDQLMVVVARAMEASRLRRENAELRRRDVTGSEMLGSSPSFKGLKSQLEKVTKSNGRVMLTGPAGSGKEMAARYIHVHSNRSGAPFVSVSSASIEPDRMEEVLFGRETPERGVEKGLLEQAHSGVVYFDEVADMPLGTQSKILRVLTEQQFSRAGGTDKVRVDLRVISSTTRDLRAEIAAGRFRQELARLRPPTAQRDRTGADPWRQRRPDRCARTAGAGNTGRGREPNGSWRHHGHPAAARSARSVRARISAGPDQPLWRQHQPDGGICRDGTLGPAPQVEIAWRRLYRQRRRHQPG